MADSAHRDGGERKVVEEGDLIQVNEDGPEHWYRCILVVDEAKSWGVQAYCVVPGRDRSSDVYMRLSWEEFDVLGVKSKFVAAELPPMMTL